MVKARLPLLFTFLFAFANSSAAQTQPTDADRLKAEIEALRLEFSSRIAALEARLKAVEEAPPPPAVAASTPEPPITPPPASSSKMFNPDIAAIGDFIGAVLRNDLKEAVGRADEEALDNLPHIVAYLYNDCPSDCWGSTARVADWNGLTARGLTIAQVRP